MQSFASHRIIMLIQAWRDSYPCRGLHDFAVFQELVETSIFGGNPRLSFSKIPSTHWCFAWCSNLRCVFQAAGTMFGRGLYFAELLDGGRAKVTIYGSGQDSCMHLSG